MNSNPTQPDGTPSVPLGAFSPESSLLDAPDGTPCYGVHDAVRTAAARLNAPAD